MTQLCLSIAEETLAGLKLKILHYRGLVPFMEARLDALQEPGLVGPGSTNPTRMIATCRPLREGGGYTGEEAGRLRLLEKAGRKGFHWIDLEHDVTESLDVPPEVSILRSYHAFSGFPEDLDGLLERLRERGGDAFKIAVRIENTSQLTRLLTWMERLPPELPRVIVGMGDYGQPSRLLGGFLGNLWTYVVEDEDQTLAPGQFSLDRARGEYHLYSDFNPSELYGVIGDPVAHSRSPQLMNALFREHSLQKLYLPLALNELGPWFDYLNSSRLKFSGFSVTIPHKKAIVDYASRIDSPGEAMNTLKRGEAGWEASNTDYAGFLQPLRQRELDWNAKKAVVLGHGGAADTVVRALKELGVKVTAVGRNRQRVQAFAGRHGCEWILFSDLPVRAHLCVNATPVGQYPHLDESPLVPEQLDFDVVYDLVYNPESTSLLKTAVQKGIQVISGMEMFVEQAACQFRTWTGIDPDRARIREFLRRQS